MSDYTIPSSVSLNKYKGLTVFQLFSQENFPMLESSGGVGREITNDIKHQLGMNDTDKFAYKILPSKDGKNNCYEIYVSTERDLKPSTDKNKKDFGEILVTGYIYQIADDGSSKMIKAGTPQIIKTYTNANGQEKIDVYGDQYTNTQTREGYKWN